MDRRYRLAIIGASKGQYPLCMKAREMGIETWCFAYEKGSVCKTVADHFVPISIMDMDAIVEECRRIGVDGVVSNASDLTARVVSYVSGKLGLNGLDYDRFVRLCDKYYVRSVTSSIDGLSVPRIHKFDGEDPGIYPCVIKPCIGNSKSGVIYAQTQTSFQESMKYCRSTGATDILVEEYIVGKEISVESISYHGSHQVVQITDKDSSSAPHFVELGHHQPADISSSVKTHILGVVPRILDAIGFDNGASHIEMKYKGENLFLIEVNPRGGGDDISNKLVCMSSGIDYLRCMIEVAMDTYKGVVMTGDTSYAGIYYLCKQTEELLPFFVSAKDKDWLVECRYETGELVDSKSNYERNGYLIYKSSKKILPDV